jgi:hypothetical protein
VADLDLILAANLKTSQMKTVQLLMEKGNKYSNMLLPYPEEMEDTLQDLATGRTSFHDAVEDITARQMVPEPTATWIYTAEPILRALPDIRERHPHLQTHCVGDRKHMYASMDNSTAIACLTLNACITDRVEHEKWRRVLRDSIRLGGEEVKGMAWRTLEKAADGSVLVCDLGDRPIRRALVEAGLGVRATYVGEFYHFTPLSVLERRLAGGHVCDRDLKALVRGHLEYVRNYVYRYGSRDRAHYEWTYDKVGWLRRRLDVGEIRLLDSIIQGD